MSLGDALASLTGPFVTAAMVRGIVPPVRLVGCDARAWPLLTIARDTLVVDEYGEVLWCRFERDRDARVVRSCWPEEATRLRPEVEHALAAILGSARARL